MRKFTNPVLNGFYPDPSVCRAGEDYYMVTSSFAYFPGLPIFHSRDLVHWEQIGHGIHDPEQLDYRNCQIKEGLWAPTIRCHEGIWYIVNSLVSDNLSSWQNFIITATEPAGPWSKAVFLEGLKGIDPSLLFDRDRLWYVGSDSPAQVRYPGHNFLYLRELDRATLQPKGTQQILLDGADFHGLWIESPHLYRHEGWYYLLFAEGGTFRDHSIMMARSRAITGPYELCPRNPVISHRHLPLEREISIVGHGDLVKTQNGEWWMTLLAVRPYQGGHYPLGRETFLLPVRWAEDGWLLADSENGLVNRQERCPELPEHFVPLACPFDSFEGRELARCWNVIHPEGAAHYSLTERPGFLRLRLSPETLEETGSPAFVGRRQQHKLCQAVTAMEFTPRQEGEEAGLVLFHDSRFHYRLGKTLAEGRPVLRLWQTRSGETTLLAEQLLEEDGRLYLAAQCNRDRYVLSWGSSPDCLEPLAQVEADCLSASVSGGFTGVYLAMYACAGGRASGNAADFDWFGYHGLDI